MNIEAKIPERYQCIENNKAKTSYFDAYEFGYNKDHFDSLKFYEKNYKIIHFIGKIPFLKNWYMALIKGTLGYIYNKESEYAEEMIRCLTISYFSKDYFIRYDYFEKFIIYRNKFIKLFDPEDSWDNTDYSRILKYHNPEDLDISWAIYEYIRFIDYDRFEDKDTEDQLKYENFMNTIFKPENLFSEKMDEYIRVHSNKLGNGGYLDEFI